MRNMRGEAHPPNGSPGNLGTRLFVNSQFKRAMPFPPFVEAPPSTVTCTMVLRKQVFQQPRQAEPSIANHAGKLQGEKMITSNFLVPFIARLSAIAVVLALGTSGAHAAGIVGTGSAASCTDAALGTALTGGGSVTFNCGAAPATISVLSTKVISANTTINGANLVTLSGGGTVQVFQVNFPAGLTLQNLAITNGRAGISGGGAIASTGLLDVANASFVANSTTDSGGAIAFNSGGAGAILTIAGSTFSGNRASGGSYGGGALLIRSGSATITNSTFSGNAHSVGRGGAIYIESGNLDLRSVTIAGNTAVGESGGLYENADDSSSQNSIFANNTPDNCGTTGYAFTGQSNYNLSSDTTCRLTNGGGVGNLVGTNPLLGPLANNGGFTQTMALTAGSPALNAGNPATPGSGGAACPATDQIGTARTQGGRCDIGAFEGIAAAPAVVVTAVPTLAYWALIGLAGLLGVFGTARLRRV